jgi:adenosylhomocysteinase
MDGSFANQVLAQIELYKQQFAAQNDDAKAALLRVEVLPKHLDEEVGSSYGWWVWWCDYQAESGSG